MRLVLIGVVGFIGMLLPAQAGMNAEFGRRAGHPLFAAAWNFVLGGAIIALATAAALAWGARGDEPIRLRTAELGQAPWWSWLGGLCGASIVLASIIAAPRLGAAMLVACVVTGQLAASSVIDHFGLFGYPARPINTERVLGLVLLAAGMLLVERSTRGG